MTWEHPFLKEKKFWFNQVTKAIHSTEPINLLEAAESEVYLTVSEISATKQVSYRKKKIQSREIMSIVRYHIMFHSGPES